MRNALTKVTIALTGLSLLFLVSACAANKSFNMKVEALGPSKSQPDLETSYDFISNLKGPQSVIIIYDASGSMLWPTVPGGEPRYKNAHKSLSKYVDGILGKHTVGLMVYGSRYPSGILNGKVFNAQGAVKSCTDDIVLTVPLAKFDKKAFQSELYRLGQDKNYRGDTPIGGSVAKAAEILQKSPGEKKHIILITDGEEECFAREKDHGVPHAVSPEAAVRAAKEKGIAVSIVAYGIGHGKDGKKNANFNQEMENLRSLATGVFVIANTGEELLQALRKVDVESFKFDLLDVDSKAVASFSLGETFKVDTTPYVSGMNALKKRLKFTISATGEQSFRKDIGIPKDAQDVFLFLRLKTPDDLNPDIEPPFLRWND